MSWIWRDHIHLREILSVGEKERDSSEEKGIKSVRSADVIFPAGT